MDGATEPSLSLPLGSTALSIPFVQIDAAMVAGAVLHPVSGLWYAPAGADLNALRQWLTHAMRVHADEVIGPQSGIDQANVQHKADVVALQSQVAELKAMVGRTPAEMWVPSAAAVPSITGPTVNTEFAPSAPMSVFTHEPDDTRRAPN
jgi:hypothetical protein